MIDYVVFQRTSVSHDDTGYRGYSFPSPNAAKRILDDNRVYLAMPKGIQTQYKANYKQMDMGVLGAAVMQGLASEGESANLGKIAANAQQDYLNSLLVLSQILLMLLLVQVISQATLTLMPCRQ